MRIARRLAIAPVLMIGPFGCNESATLEQLRARAAYDLDCPASKIRTTEIDERTRGVSGCGQRATYVEACDRVGQYGIRTDCTWVQNGDRRGKSSDDD
jgi:hypothetical protein